MTRTPAHPHISRWLWRIAVAAVVVALLQPVWAAVVLLGLAWIGTAALLTWHRRRVWVFVAATAVVTAVLALGEPSQTGLVFAAPAGVVIGWTDIFLDRIARKTPERVESEDSPALVDEQADQV